MKKVPIKYLTGIRWIEASRIVRFEANGTRTLVLLADNTEIYSFVTLKHYTDMSDMTDFYRIHDKHFVNKKFIEQYNPKTRLVTLTCKTQLEASFKKKSDFLKFMYENNFPTTFTGKMRH